MVTDNHAQKKLRDIINVLPKKNCGKCGFENCARFAEAVINGGAYAFGCRQSSSAGYAISEILGLALPEEHFNQPASKIDQTFRTRQVKQHGQHHGGHHGHHRHHSKIIHS